MADSASNNRPSSTSRLSLTFIRNHILERIAQDRRTDDSIQVENLHTPITPSGIEGLILTIFKQGEDILRIADGLAILKNRQTITDEEIQQAIEIHKTGHEGYLPNYEWLWQPRNQN